MYYKLNTARRLRSFVAQNNIIQLLGIKQGVEALSKVNTISVDVQFSHISDKSH